MRIYFYRYNSIFEPDCIDVFKKFGIDVFEEKVEITKKDLTQAERIDIVVKRLLDAFELDLLVGLCEVGAADIVPCRKPVDNGDVQAQAYVLAEIVVQLVPETGARHTF